MRRWWRCLVADDIVTRLRARPNNQWMLEAADEIERLRAERDDHAKSVGTIMQVATDEIERLRFAGDALAAAYEAETQPQSDREWKITQMWEEARRG